MGSEGLGLQDNFSQPVDRLLRLPKFGAGAGLHRMQHFKGALPPRAWIDGIDAIRVTGSKGKGSVSALIAAILAQLGIRTGLYTSPHLLRFHERIQINGECISPSGLLAASEWVFGELEKIERQAPGERVGAFEAFTAAALHYFGSQAVEAVVSEAGLGGRYDSTRAIPGRIVCLTSVELEHAELLGGTAEMIAYDKVDLCREGGVLVVGEIEAEVARRLRAYCSLRQVEVIAAPQESAISNLRYDGRWMRFELVCRGLDLGELATPLLGDHQAGNTAVAVLALQQWLAAHRPGVTASQLRDAISAALRSIDWPGRLQRVGDGPEIMIDVGHTPQSMRVVANALRRIYRGKPILLVTGVSEDKNISGVLSQLTPIAAEIVCTRAYHKGAAVASILEFCRRFAPGVPCSSASTIEAAMDTARERALAGGMAVVVAGGLFLAIEALVSLKAGDPQKLRFF